MSCISVLVAYGASLTIVQAHPAGQQIRYVATTGQDQADCLSPQTPCQTILYAVSTAQKGNEIRVAKGAYSLPLDQVDQVLKSTLFIRGGFNELDYFSIQDPDRNPTYLLGPTFAYRHQLYEQGIQLVTDAKGLRWIGPSLDQAIQPPPPSANAKQIQTSAVCENGFASIYPCQNVDLLGQISLEQFSSSPGEANDIWGFVDMNDNREYAIIGLQNGTAVVDVTDPASPVEIGTISGKSTIWRDIKVYQFYNEDESRWNAYAYVAADGMIVQGLQIIDLTGLPNTISLANTYTEFNIAHNVFLSHVDHTTGITISGSSAYAFIPGSNLDGGAFRILDLQNPVSPTLVSQPTAGMQYSHDVTTLVITDTRTADCDLGHNPCELIIDFNENTVDIWDVTDKTSPLQISSTPYIGARYTHSGWWSADKQFVFIQDESDERAGNPTTLRTLDISDLTNPTISNVWQGPTNAIDHNGFTKGDRYYMSNYERGLTILDISDPNDPQPVGLFDTFPSRDDDDFNGAWGVYPYLPSGTILVSDINRGLFLLREQSTNPDPDPDPTPPEPPSLDVSLQVNSHIVNVGETMTYTYRITNTANVTQSIQATDDRFGAVPLSLTGNTATILLSQLAPQAVATGLITDIASFEPISNLLTNTVTVTGTVYNEPLSQTVKTATVSVMVVENLVINGSATSTQTLGTQDQALSLAVPSGALSSNAAHYRYTPLSTIPASLSPPTGINTMPQQVFRLELIDEAGLVIDEPTYTGSILLTIRDTDIAQTSVFQASLTLYAYDQATQNWVQHQPVSLDLVEQTITVVLPPQALYAVFETTVKSIYMPILAK
ncbi:MAG: choice-of-anchor B family protein [Chloroflexota bacterium]